MNDRPSFDPTAVVASCIEHGRSTLLLESDDLPEAFFDLSTGVAGELLHRIDLYRIRLAVVVPDPGVHSRPFRDFVVEANRGTRFRFLPTREEAEAWLATG